MIGDSERFHQWYDLFVNRLLPIENAPGWYQFPDPVLPQQMVPIGTPGEQTFVRGWRWVTYADDGIYSWIVRAGVEAP